jgi:anti-sigma regulatory factor (Ser/Thr protein kinase)
MKKMMLVQLEAADIPRAGDWIERVCISFGLDDTEAFKVKTCVVEAINNCIEHAYEGQVGNVTLSVWEEDKQIKIQIVDEGRVPKTIERDASADQLPDPYSESGRGLAIIRAWMDDLSMTRNGSSNILCMSKRIPQ